MGKTKTNKERKLTEEKAGNLFRDMNDPGFLKQIADPHFAMAQFQILFNETPLGIYLVDAEFRLRAVNPIALPVFGDIPDLIGRDFDETIHRLWEKEFADEIVRIFHHTLETGEPYFESERIENRRDRAAIEYYEWQINRIPMPEGGYGVVCYFRDISSSVLARQALAETEEKYRSQLEKEVDDRMAEIKKLNNQLTIANKELESLNAELKTFNNIAANDYNETLRHLYTSLEYVVSNDARNLSDAGRANIRRAQAGIQKMKLLTDDILSYTKLHELETEEQPAEINSIIKNVLVDFEKKHDLSDIQIDFNNLPVINCYPFLVSIVFHHLVDNAFKFRKTDDNLQIKITCREYVAEPGTDMPEAQPNTHYHIISVTDNGIGFSRQEAKRIFDIFYRINDKHIYKGTGIGLAVCKKIMNIHGGFITTESEPGKGSTFHCFFPVREN